MKFQEAYGAPEGMCHVALEGDRWTHAAVLWNGCCHGHHGVPGTLLPRKLELGHQPPCPAIPFAGPLLCTAAPWGKVQKVKRKGLRTNPDSSLIVVTVTVTAQADRHTSRVQALRAFFPRKERFSLDYHPVWESKKTL